MSAQELISQIKEDYLTCSICFICFTKPKALPCLHTFCQDCLRDYVASRGYESAGCFPCPMCRKNTVMPAEGVAGFSDNHLMSSLSETVDKSSGRPVPKPRRLLGKPNNAEYSQVTQTVANANAEVADSDTTVAATNWCQDSRPDVIPAPQQSSSSSLLSDREKPTLGDTEDMSTNHSMSQHGSFSHLSSTWQTTSTEVNDHDSWASYTHMLEPPPPYYPPLDLVATSLPPYPDLNNYVHSTTNWSSSSVLDNAHSHVNSSQLGNSGHHHPTQDSVDTGPAPVFYPALQAQTETNNVACTENLLLKFGKQGSSVRDFLKPIGLAVSREGSYIISDSSGDQNRIFIFNNKGELTTAFNCGCKVKDVIVTKENEILAAVHKNGCAIRHFTMAGACKAEYGKFFTFEEPSGIGQLTNGGLVVSGTLNHCVYILTDRMKLATKFGRKGGGEGYFQHPGYVTVDSKNQIIVTDKVNNSVQVFSTDGKLRQHFGSTGTKHGQLQSPLGVCVDASGNIIVADSGNSRVEMFSSKGRWLKSVVTNTNELGDKVKPVNVAVTPAGHIAVLLRGPYFAEVRVYATKHKNLVVQKEGSVDTGASVRYSK